MKDELEKGENIFFENDFEYSLHELIVFLRKCHKGNRIIKWEYFNSKTLPKRKVIIRIETE